MSDYIPAKDADYVNWSTNFAALITANPTRYGLEVSDATAIQTAADDWATAYQLAIDPATRTPVTVAAKDAQRQTTEGVQRPYAMRVNADPTVSDEDRQALGLTVRDRIPTPVPPPTTAPALELRQSTPGETKLAYSDTGSPDGKAKPAGAVGVQVFRTTGASPETDPAAAGYLLTATKSPFVATNDAASRGQIATYFARFVTRGGPGGVQQNGPWSAPLSVTAT